MGEVIQFPRRFTGLMSKRQLARTLNRSTRWVELMMRDQGLPFTRDSRGYSQFDIAAVERWQSSQREANSV